MTGRGEVEQLIVIILMVFALLAWLVPAKQRRDDGPPLTDEERASFRPWLPASLIIWFLSAVASVFLWYGAFRGLATLLLKSGAGTVFLMTPEVESLVLPAILLGIVSSWPATAMVLRAMLRSRYPRFDRWANEDAFFDGHKVAIGVGCFVAVVVVAFFVYWSTTVTRIRTDGIELGRAWSFRTEQIPYSRVRSVQVRDSFRAPSGKLIWHRHYAIIFDDGREWLTRGPLRKSIPEDARAMAYVAARTGRAIEAVAGSVAPLVNGSQ
jgi:hypothetical protein